MTTSKTTSKTDSLLRRISQAVKGLSLDDLEEQQRDLKEQIEHVGPVVAIALRLETVEILIARKTLGILPNTLNKQQRIAVKVYGSGDFAHVTSLKEAEKQGDTLFAFVMRELSDDEGCDSIDEGINRMHRAVDDLQVVEHALMKGGQ